MRSGASSWRAGVVFSCLLATGAAGQNIVAKVGSTTIASTTNGNDLTIPLGTISTDTLLRIYDDLTNSTTAPSLSVGKVTINGSIASGSGATLQVLVANSSVTAFPGNGQVQNIVLPGVVNLGRSTGTTPGGLVIPDTNLRNATVLALATTGDLSGDIDVGRVFRIQALGRVENSQFLGGVIASNITAHAPDVFAPLPDGVLGDYAINVVTAGDLISGNIVATGVYDDLLSNSRRGTIGRIVVGPSENARGITGNIEARSSDISVAFDGVFHPSIGAIFTTGPIGTSTAPIVINAGNGIGEIRTAGESSTGTVLARDIHVNLNADYGSHGAETAQDNTPGNDLQNLGCMISRIRTAGAISGSIRAWRIGASEDSLGQRGILSEGPNSATIEILDIASGDIIAPTFIAPPSGCQIVVHKLLKGSVIAYDEANGHIPCVRIPAYNGFGEFRGLVIDPQLPPIVPSATDPRDNWFLERVFPPQHPGRPSIDSVIRAKTIGTLEIGWMSHNVRRVGAETSAQSYRPRVEAQVIDDLDVFKLSAGVIWSGQMEYGSGGNNPANDFAAIGQCKIGCIGRAGSVWYTETPYFELHWPEASFAQFYGVIHGEVHTDTLDTMQRLRVGRAIVRDIVAANASECICEYYVDESSSLAVGCQAINTFSFPEVSPRAGVFPTRGLVQVHDAAGLKGRIILNANANRESNGALLIDPTTWGGDVKVLDRDVVNVRTVSVDFTLSDDYRGPFYKRIAYPFGNGTIGAVSYGVYQRETGFTCPMSEPTPTACDQANETGHFPRVATQEEFSQLAGHTPRGVMCTFYGPIKTGVLNCDENGCTPAVSDAPVELWWEHTSGWMRIPFTAWRFFAPIPTVVEPINHFTIFINPARNVTQMMPPGNYRVTLRPPGDGTRLYSALLFPEVPSGTEPQVRHGSIASDGELVLFTFSVTGTTGTGDETGHCLADFDDGTGTGTPDDGVTIDDLLYYLALFEDGAVGADVDNGDGTGQVDGGVTIDDLLYFIYHFTAGC